MDTPLNSAADAGVYLDQSTSQLQRLMTSATRHGQALQAGEVDHALAWQTALVSQWQRLGSQAGWPAWQAFADYLQDAVQRGLLTLDTLRERGNNDRAHLAAGTPPVLDYDYETVLDGASLRRPTNYRLLRIQAPSGVVVDERKQPFMIIDPRAGHGAGIGGFKPDSQVGVALRAGHPVYFVVFGTEPAPGQTLADVLRTETRFLREVARRHPDAPKPVVVGNCQGGWATLLLAAANPELTGPLVINGAPVDTWGGEVGANPMRYKGGLAGGAVPAVLAADLGGGRFDGAHLVSNFESLNPARNYFGKYYDLYENVDAHRQSFLEFERWWGGYHFTNENEIRWIVEQLFIGNKLSRGEAQLEPGLTVDLRRIKSPIIVFASLGDNITPPAQALNWIADTFTDEHEIRIRGQRIVYMVHEKVGHLGIFVSATVARKEHQELASTLKTIESMAPGLYEMQIEEGDGEPEGPFRVTLHERSIEQLLGSIPNDRDQEHDFAAVAKISDAGMTAYEMLWRPWVKAMVTPALSKALEDLHPGRLSRRLLSDENPMLAWLGPVAASVRARRAPVSKDNPFRQLERSTADAITHAMDRGRQLRDAGDELAFIGLYGNPYLRQVGSSHGRQRVHKTAEELLELPEVQTILNRIDQGDIAAAVIRMLVLLADSRGSVRRDRLERSTQVMTMTEPFASMGMERRGQLIQEQSVIAEFNRDGAVQTLPALLEDEAQRRQALETVYFVLGERSDMEPQSLHTLEQFEQVLGLPAPGRTARPPRTSRTPKKASATARRAPRSRSPQ
ncbi:DUF3141 domain-containing protein [Ideonella sp. 4Y11]|uniref:DUF3141 domain-containing protein n=1 Tax=Ideonella aquatica TaxID=2824119 RepID=A0A940YEZ1_9BURK|nr:DUF3141 domain-containing protein [Ideonella aquatica]MBQ0958074.1 DUF3141 domain-containing protein [Ideonella aquatica]